MDVAEAQREVRSVFIGGFKPISDVANVRGRKNNV